MGIINFEQVIHQVVKSVRDDASNECTDRFIETMAKEAATSNGLDWDVLPDKSDAACGHGFPEGCKQYWILKVTRAVTYIVSVSHQDEIHN